MKKIGIIDYGMGNLFSVCGALKYLGITHFVSSDIAELDCADGLILPGVGAFPDAMKALDTHNITQFLRNRTDSSRPLLGICLGMQLLFDKSYEFGETDGLGLIGGEICPLTAYKNSREYKIPHMGWNSLTIKNSSPLFVNLPVKPYVYFVHSFKADNVNNNELTATSEYGEEITAAVQKGNVYGTQFHPEKSGEIGLSILRSFGELI